jgi:hypothetical protein
MQIETLSFLVEHLGVGIIIILRALNNCNYLVTLLLMRHQHPLVHLGTSSSINIDQLRLMQREF